MDSTRLESILAKFDQNDPEVVRYVKARLSDFVPIAKTFLFEQGQMTASLSLKKGTVDLEVSSGTPAFILLVASHFWTMGDNVRLGEEFPASGSKEKEEDLRYDLPKIEVRCNLLRLGTQDVERLEVSENSEKNDRSYRLWCRADHARLVVPVPVGPSIEITLSFGQRLFLTFKGYVDTISPFNLKELGLVEMRGGDLLTGARVRFFGRFNSQVNPETTILGFATWIVPSALGVPETSIPKLPGIDQFLGAGVSPMKFSSFIQWLQGLAKSKPDLAQLCNYFMERLSPDHPMLHASPVAFQNMACLISTKIPAYIAIGSIRGIKTKGIVRIAPGVVIASPEHLPIHIVGESLEAPLCKTWDPHSAVLVTFFKAEDAPATRPAGWAALSHAFELLNVSLCDGSWTHEGPEGTTLTMSVDGRLLDAELELDRIYHVHEVTSGLAHQYHAGVSKVSHELSLDDAAVGILRQRLDPLHKRVEVTLRNHPKLAAHLSRAIQWLSRSRSSTTFSERFLCLWIALEYLALRGSEAGESDAILSAVQRRIPPLLGRANRDQKKQWKAITEDSYRLRCKLVHEAAEDQTELERLVPYLGQAVFEIIWYCTALEGNTDKDDVPADLLDKFAKKGSA